jgi:hypothetical protein
VCTTLTTGSTSDESDLAVQPSGHVTSVDLQRRPAPMLDFD